MKIHEQFYKKPIHQFAPYFFSGIFLGLIAFSYYFFTNVLSNILTSALNPDLYTAQGFTWSSFVQMDTRGVFSILYLYILCLSFLCFAFGLIGVAISFIFKKKTIINKLTDEKNSKYIRVALLVVAIAGAIGFYIWVGVSIAQVNDNYDSAHPVLKSLLITGQVVINYCIGLIVIILVMGLLNWVLIENKFSSKIKTQRQSMRIEKQKVLIIKKGKRKS